MAKHRQTLLLWSGVGAFCLYCFALFALLFTFSSVFVRKYVPQADTAFEQAVAIDLSTLESNEISDKDSGTHLEGMSVKDIFSTIPDLSAPPKEIGDDRSQNAKNTKDKTDQDKLRAIQERLDKLSLNTNTATDSKTLDVQSQSISPEFADGEYNEWFGKIYDIIYRRWQAKYYQDARVSVLLRITNTGSFHYRITRFSQYDDYNQSVVALLESLKQEQLPPYPKGRVIEIEVNFSQK